MGLTFKGFELPVSIKPDCMGSIEKEGIVEDVRGRLHEIEKELTHWEREQDQRQIDACHGAIDILKWVLTDLLESSIV